MNKVLTWFDKKPEWEKFYDHPDPYELRKAGFSYFYYDREYWEDRSPKDRARFTTACVLQVAENSQPATGDYRRLLDIRACQP